MNKLQLVTGFWHVREDRKEEDYLKNLKNVLAIPHNISVFIPKKYEAFVLDNRTNLIEKTDIHFVELDDIKNKYFVKYWNKVEKIRNNPVWLNSTDWLKSVPQGFSQWYNPIVMSKVFFVRDAYNKNTFDAQKYIWVDAGITQHIPNEFVSELSMTNFSRIIETVFFTAFEYENHREVHGFNYMGFSKYTEKVPQFVCRATTFGFDKDHIIDFCDAYEYYLSDTLDRGYLGTEESLFTLMSAINFDYYNLYNMGKQSMPIDFLKRLATGDSK